MNLINVDPQLKRFDSKFIDIKTYKFINNMTYYLKQKSSKTFFISA